MTPYYEVAVWKLSAWSLVWKKIQHHTIAVFWTDGPSHTAWNQEAIPDRFNTYDPSPDLCILLLLPLPFCITVVDSSPSHKLDLHYTETIPKHSQSMNEMRKKQESYRQMSTKKQKSIDQSDQAAGRWCTHSPSVCSVPPGQLINCC